MSTPEPTLAQRANQQMAVVAVSITFLDTVGVAERLADNQIRIHLLRRIFALSLRAAGIPVPTFTMLGQSQFAASQFWNERECVVAMTLGDAHVKQAIEALRAELETVFVLAALVEKIVGIAHFDWNEARWIRDFPLADPRPFAPWLDYLRHIRTTNRLEDQSPDVRRLFGDTDD